ncbi:MAG TPA: hypothetical protein VMQ62_02265 [Dongiaceae bacterium]|nr:hypothetical protein [Dongiaceae bacterium]
MPAIRAALLTFILGFLSAPLPAAPAPDLPKEEALLARLKEDRYEALAGQLREAAGEQRMGVLLQLASLGTERAIDLVDRNIDSVADRPTLLNAVASEGHREAGPLLLRAVRTWGPDAGHPIERLHFVLGPEVADELRRTAGATTSDAVRRAVRAELIRLGDGRAIADLRRDLAAAKLASRDDAQSAIDILSVASECFEVAGVVGALFRRVDPGRSDVHRQLTQYAAGVALWLGDRDSVGRVVELLGSPSPAALKYPGLHSLEEILTRNTHQVFATTGEWKAWWESTGRRTPLFTVHVPPADEAAIINAAVAWGRTPAAGPLISGPIVYLQDDAKYRRGREQVQAGLDAGIRPYTGGELTLLEKRPFAVFEIESNGETAFATLGDGSNRSNWRLARLELAKREGAWRVLRRVSS